MMEPPDYRLLRAFESLFRGTLYRHRSSTQSDYVALHLYEDMFKLGKSPFLKKRVKSGEWVVNAQNRRHGIKARRGDATFGEKVPGADTTQVNGFTVLRGKLATVEIGVEMKILAKAMIKQIDRVINDLGGQIAHFRKGGGNPISVGIVGINHATQYTSYEGDRPFPTNGRKYQHPIQEARKAEKRITDELADRFNHYLLFLRFRATNADPFPFEWVDPDGMIADYGALLTRISREYSLRFRNGHDE